MPADKKWLGVVLLLTACSPAHHTQPAGRWSNAPPWARDAANKIVREWNVNPAQAEADIDSAPAEVQKLLNNG